MKKTNLVLVVILTLVGHLAFAEDYHKTALPNADKTNSGINKRDSKASNLTPEQQADGTTSDVEVTRQIRELVVKDDSLSTNGHNVKIITLNRVTTLRGPVDSEQEKMKIVAIAKKVAGTTAVHNQLEVKTK